MKDLKCKTDAGFSDKDKPVKDPRAPKVKEFNTLEIDHRLTKVACDYIDKARGDNHLPGIENIKDAVITKRKTETKSKFDVAREIVYDMCNGGKKFRMCVPVNENDSDSILIEMIDLAEKLTNETETQVCPNCEQVLFPRRVS